MEKLAKIFRLLIQTYFIGSKAVSNTKIDIGTVQATQKAKGGH